MKKAQPSWRRFFSARSLFQSFWLKNDISSTIRTRSFISFNHYLEQFHLILKSWITCKALFTGIKRKRISRDFQNSEKADAVYNHFLSRLIRSLLHPFLNNNSKLANQAEKQSSRKSCRVANSLREQFSLSPADLVLRDLRIMGQITFHT